MKSIKNLNNESINQLNIIFKNLSNKINKYCTNENIPKYICNIYLDKIDNHNFSIDQTFDLILINKSSLSSSINDSYIIYNIIKNKDDNIIQSIKNIKFLD